jgi:hypothetical protein
MTAGQRAIVAARAMPMFEEAAKASMVEGGKSKGKPGSVLPSRQSRDDAAAVFKVGKNSVQQAKAVLAGAPDLAAGLPTAG